MRVCGLGGPEVVIIALLAFVVFGPERTQEVALAAGRFLRTLTRTDWWRDFTRMAREIRDLPNTLVRLAELEETQAELERSLSGIQEDIKADLETDIILDPWGIENAVADSTAPEERTSKSPQDDDGDETAQLPEADGDAPSTDN